MNYYTKHILPARLSRSMDNPAFHTDRKWVTQSARGVVLEIGFGSGLNLPFYHDIAKLYALEPSAELYAYAQKSIAETLFPVEHIATGAENIPLEDASIDTVISTWSLCSVADPEKVMHEIARVLKPGGTFSCAEHGMSPKPFLHSLQTLGTFFTKIWDGNCHLDRDIVTLIQKELMLTDVSGSTEPSEPLGYNYLCTGVKR